jgi:hypothetical protein
MVVLLEWVPKQVVQAVQMYQVQLQPMEVLAVQVVVLDLPLQ